MRTGMNGSSFCYAKYLHCGFVIVIIGTQNTDVLSTTAVNDLVMNYYIMIHVAYTAHQGQK